MVGPCPLEQSVLVSLILGIKSFRNITKEGSDSEIEVFGLVATILHTLLNLL